MAGAPTPSWHPGRWKAGQHVRWRGIVLVCCTPHVAPVGAVHPWDVDLEQQQRPSEAALYWAPNGDAECARLRALLVDNRQSWGDHQRATINFACGHATKAA